MIRLASLLLVSLLFGAPARAEDAARRVLALDINGVINPVIGDYISKGLEEADSSGAAAVLIRLDTPGGLLDSTRSAVSAMINAEVPVIVYVAPRGSRATSAGVFLMMAADVAAMAPETHLGAAHPVSIGGDDKKPADTSKDQKKEKESAGDKSVMEEKMVSDAAAYIRTLAEERGRNAAWAEKAVRDSVSLTAKEALDQKVIDLLATSEEELFRTASGRTVKKGGKELKIDLSNATVEAYPMTAAQKFLHILGHPNVAYILMTIGIYGLIYELAAPGIGLGGAIGGICLLLAFFSLQVLPLSTVGIALIVLAVALLVLEMIAPSHGLLTLGGLVAFAVGSFLMIDGRGFHFPRVSLPLILSTVGTTALFFGVAIRQIWTARRTKIQVGVEALAGASGTVQEDLAPEGIVDLSGELWTARLIAGESAIKGERVRVVRLEGNVLIVEKTTTV